MDYQRCPTGEMHDLVYTRYPDGQGIYNCRHCALHTDKSTMKANTDIPPAVRRAQIELWLRELGIDPVKLKELASGSGG